MSGLQLEPSEEQVLVSSSGDKTASVWDRRKLAPGVKPLATATANNTILSAYFSPAGMSLYVCSPDWPGIVAVGRRLMLMSSQGLCSRHKGAFSLLFPWRHAFVWLIPH